MYGTDGYAYLFLKGKVYIGIQAICRKEQAKPGAIGERRVNELRQDHHRQLPTFGWQMKIDGSWIG
jgi:hypothetical protein